MMEKLQWKNRSGLSECATLLTSAFAPRRPARIEAVDDTLTAELAFRRASEGTALIWEGDFQNARQLLTAMAKRVDARKKSRRESKAGGQTLGKPSADVSGKRAATPRSDQVLDPAQFHAHRMAQANRARMLSMLWVRLDDAYRVLSRRAPDVALACQHAFGPPEGLHVIALRELLGVIGAQQWRERGVPVPALGADARIHPYYGVFSPVRGEYLDLVHNTSLPTGVKTAWDIGTGTGVLAAILARRGVAHVTGTDTSETALACARYNVAQLGLASQVDIVRQDLFPAGQADLIVCNPPWLPAKPTSAIEQAVYDAEGAMTKGVLQGLTAHLTPDGEGWLIMSDLAERLGLRSADWLAQTIASSGLTVVQRITRAPVHPKSQDAADPLAQARMGERTTLWRLRAIR